MSWKSLEDHQPDLAAFGAQRLHGNVAYLATVRQDGSPRVHPVTPIFGQGHLFMFMEPTSPKGHDLLAPAGSRRASGPPESRYRLTLMLWLELRIAPAATFLTEPPR